MKGRIIFQGKVFENTWPTLITNNSGFDVRFELFNLDNSKFDLNDYELHFKARKIALPNECQPITNQIDSLCNIIDKTSGVAIYTFTTSDLTVYGKFETELEAVNNINDIIISTKIGELNIKQNL
jgi:hypothetical protein